MEKTIFGDEIPFKSCQGCLMKNKEFFKQGKVYVGNYFCLGQDTELAYPGLMVISSLIHKENYEELNEDELKELNYIMKKCKQGLKEIFNCNKFSYIFNEKQGSHLHFIVVPLHGLIEFKNKYSVVKELIDKKELLIKDGENFEKVNYAIKKLKEFFN